MLPTYEEQKEDNIPYTRCMV